MFTLDQVVPWGRSFDEYRRMFALTDDDFAAGSSGAAMARRASTRKRRAAARGSSPAIRSIAGDARRSGSASPRPATRSSSRPGATPASSSGTDSVGGGARPGPPGRDAGIPGRLRRAGPRDDTSKRSCRRCRLPTRPSTWRCARISCSSTPASSARRFIGRRFRRCAAWPPRSASSRCSRSAGRRRRLSTGVGELRDAGYDVSIEDVPYEFQRGGNQMMRVRRERNP